MENKSITSDLPVHIYGVSEKKGNFIFETFREIIKEFPAAHSLGFLFAKRNIKAKYRQSVFGILWALLPALSTAFIWIVLNKASVISMETPGVPYPLFVIAGTMLWTVFSNAIILPIQAMQANRNILVKINFQRESILISAFYEILFNLLLSFIIILLSLIYFKVTLSFTTLLFIPGVLCLLVLGMAFGLLLLPVSMLYKDVQFALPTVLQFLMYLSPVVYALTPGQVNSVLALNPVTPLLTNTRSWLLNIEPVFSFQPLLIILCIAFFLLLVGIVLQRATMQILIERMGS